MKSQILRTFELKLRDINDQFCYFLFADVEVNNILLELESNVSDSFTSEVFSENNFSKRLHIKVSALPEFRNKSFHTLVSMNVIAAVEYLLSFIEGIQEFRSEVTLSNYDTPKNIKAEEMLEINLTNWLGKKPESAIIRTIKYLRLRRNHIVHVQKDLTKEYRSLIKNDSRQLNTYWSERTTKLNDFDFAKESSLEFEINEVFALINLSRICMREVDTAVLSTISEEMLVNYELSIFLKNNQLNGIELDRTAHKFKSFLRHQYGKEILCSDSVIRAYFENSLKN